MVRLIAGEDYAFSGLHDCVEHNELLRVRIAEADLHTTIGEHTVAQLHGRCVIEECSPIGFGEAVEEIVIEL